jgi:hypothetical protein
MIDGVQYVGQLPDVSGMCREGPITVLDDVKNSHPFAKAPGTLPMMRRVMPRHLRHFSPHLAHSRCFLHLFYWYKKISVGILVMVSASWHQSKPVSRQNTDVENPSGEDEHDK